MSFEEWLNGRKRLKEKIKEEIEKYELEEILKVK